MKIMVITGSCLKTNSSANLCHISYINGMLKLGHSVDLLSFSEEGQVIDKGITMPKVSNHYVYDGLSLYEKLAVKNTNNKTAESHQQNNKGKEERFSFKNKLVRFIKKKIRASYGIYNPSIVWYRRAKKFHAETDYDIVISLSYPMVSHLLAGKLVRSGRVKTKRYIQIWEDPWAIDLYNISYSENEFGQKTVVDKKNYIKCKKAENKVLGYADEIVYVSPITLQNQKKLFPEHSDKMCWYPLPSYYSANQTKIKTNHKSYGYFGDYAPRVRNLTPFYNAAVSLNIDLTICGNPSDLFEETNTVKIHPRLTLDKLKPIEDKTNVLVFVCNLYGGQIPGKIYQYAATDKTVLFILDGSEEEKCIIKKYFSQFNRFVFCDNNEVSIKEAIQKIDKNDLNEIENKPLMCFSEPVIVKQIIEDKKG